jgi:leader peptidase (prepilin peptidase)/N-methyltransferase
MLASLPLESLLLIGASPFIGSFLGVVIERQPAGRPIALARSRCDRCGHALGGRDLIPVLSWLAAGGSCRHCGQAIGWFPLAVELAAIAVALWSVAVLPGWLAVAGAGLGWTLLALAWIDARHFLLPDALTLPLGLAGIAVAGVIDPARAMDHLIGAAAGFAVFAGIAAIYRRWRGRDGLGLGDAKLLAALGAWVGWQGLPTVVLYAALAGLLWAFARAVRGAPLHARHRVPFGPFLGLAGWLVWLYGPLTPG